MSASLSYHRLTNHSPERPWHQPSADDRIVQDFTICDPGLRPAQFKTYFEGMPIVDLPVTWTRSPTAGWDLEQLARLLFHSVGVVRYRDTDAGPAYFRAAGSAGNRHPLESYVVVTSALPGIPAGVWQHDPLGHQLRRVGSAPADGPSYVVVTGVPWRSAWKYAERAWRHLWWDCGTAMSQMLALAHSAGLPARVKLNFPDEMVGALVGADGVLEHPLALLVLGDGIPSCAPAGPVITGTLDPGLSFPLIPAVHSATRATGPGWQTVAPQGNHALESIEDIITKRGSTRRFDSRTMLAAGELGWTLATAIQPVPWDAGPSLLAHHVIVHDPGDFDPGRYEWRDGSLKQHGAADHDHREATHRFCLDMDLARDAAFLVVHCADLPSTLDRLGERGYRAANFEAGVVEGRLHLAAHALGRGASGLVFNDDLTPAFLRTDTTALLATAVGVPAYRAIPGGPPRQPARLRSSR